MKILRSDFGSTTAVEAHETTLQTSEFGQYMAGLQPVCRGSSGLSRCAIWAGPNQPSLTATFFKRLSRTRYQRSRLARLSGAGTHEGQA